MIKVRRSYYRIVLQHQSGSDWGNFHVKDFKSYSNQNNVWFWKCWNWLLSKTTIFRADKWIWTKWFKFGYTVGYSMMMIHLTCWWQNRYGGSQNWYRELPKFSNSGKILSSSCSASKIVPSHEIKVMGPFQSQKIIFIRKTFGTILIHVQLLEV